MQLGMIGLGKMGANMTRRLLLGDHQIFVFDLDQTAVEAAANAGATALESVEDIPTLLSAPRAVWIMVPAGNPTEETVQKLVEILEPGDFLIDGGNSNFKDSMRRAALAGKRGVRFVDVGVSGGVWGLENGYSMMIGGDEQAISELTPIFQTLAPDSDQGWARVGKNGAGHYAKMVHNGIEYGLMQAYAEGFEILQGSQFDLDLKQLCDIWNHGSVVRSWLLELAGNAFSADPDLKDLEGFVSDSGEGRWTLEESVALDVPAPVLYAALMTRFRSRQESSFQAKVLAALRNQFGGHAVKKAGS